MAQALSTDTVRAPGPRAPLTRLSLAWLGILPFFAFIGAFLLWPAVSIVVNSFLDAQGRPTLQNIGDLGQPFIVASYLYTVQLSAVTALIGGLAGFLLAYAVTVGHLPSWARAGLLGFSGVASNFAGIPLALAFIFTLGRVGFMTVFLKDIMGIDIYANGFSLYSKLGVENVYLYFQFPLMVLIMAPAIDGLRQDWREASENMGASTFQFWRYVALPILTPSLLGTMILLFGNSFGAQATVYQLTGGQINLVPLLIGRQMTGDVLHNTGLGFALAMGMVAIMGVTILIYLWLQRRAERWYR
jgi:putative spermidine/putrescine transport system permease protein